MITISAVPTQPEFKFDLTGGQLAVDFANTVSWRGHPSARKERLNGPADLVSFAVQERVLTPKQALALKRPVREFHKALSLREAIYRIFAAVAMRKSPPPADLRALNDCVLTALGHRQLIRLDGRYRWEWKDGKRRSLERILWPIVIAASDLLTSEDVNLVRLCEASDCGWLFLDHSRNRSRRWCDMKSCGNRAKARRHYERTHE